jgi:hypothetical protein
MMGLEYTTFCTAKGTGDPTTPDPTDGNPHGYSESRDRREVSSGGVRPSDLTGT